MIVSIGLAFSNYTLMYIYIYLYIYTIDYLSAQQTQDLASSNKLNHPVTTWLGTSTSREYQDNGIHYQLLI